MKTAALLWAWSALTLYVSVAQLAAGKWHDRGCMAASFFRWSES